MDKDDDVLQNDICDLYNNYPEEAIPLVIFNEEKKLFELNEEAHQYLQDLQGPIGTIAVAGMYRTGKSYLLNRMLLERSNGFGVGPTINPCTKGVWMWGKPVQGMTPDGDPINVIIMDTEGLGALDEDSNHDVRIFSLAILLSSYFIYNSVGSIDENALQNLSLVINLTKHIQIKSSGISQDDVDPEEYAKYFPSFMWVVRDFTLQLVDQEGEQISPKEYLEKALSNQKGFSDSVEQKNRIRRLLKSFFTDRDCVTMIRPLTNEAKLQELINIPMEDLRPEFVDQVQSLRKKVLNRVKPKKINGKVLNGAMFWNLLKSYVESINKGSIPSIESSWAYICKNECLKATDNSFDLYLQTINEELKAGGPFYEQELKDIYNTSKKVALDHFQKIAVGEVKDKYLEDLKEKMKQKYLNIKQDNEQSCEQECIMFLRQSYTEIERALKNLQYASFIDYLHDIEQFKAIFEESGPPGSNRKQILLEFCLKAVMESSEFFIGNVRNEINMQRTLAEETIRKLQNEVQEVKADQKDRLESLETKMRKAEIEKAELSAKEQSAREACQQATSERSQIENELNAKLTQQRKDYERTIEEMSQKVSMSDDLKKEIQREAVSSASEFDKQKALLDQKIEFLEKALEDSTRREKEVSTELKNCKKEFLSANKEQNQALEKQLKDQNRQLDDMKEQAYEAENRSSELEMALEEQKASFNDVMAGLNKELAKSTDLEADLKRKHESLQKKYDQESKLLKTGADNEKLLSEQRMADLEAQLKETQDTFEMGKQAWVKEEAVLKQKLEFVQYQLEDEKKKFEENRQAHESMLKSLQSSNRESVIGKEEAAIKINEMEQKFTNERKLQEEQYNEYRKRLTGELETLKKKNNEIELAHKLKISDLEKESASLSEQLLEAEQSRDHASKQLKNVNAQKGTMADQYEERFMQREKELEDRLDDKDKEIEDLIDEHKNKSENSLSELKKFYEDEKVRLETRAVDEKARFEKKLNQAIDDYEERITEMNNNHEDAYNSLEEEKNAMESNLQNILNQYEKEIQVQQQQLDSREKQLAEIKENYQILQDATNKANDNQADKFGRERRDLNDRIEQLSSEVSKRERAILSLENQKDGIAGQMKAKDKQVDEVKQEAQAEKVSLMAKIEDLKLKYDQSMDELTQTKINFEREKALKDQRLTFQEQRIKEYHDQMTQSIERYEERLKQEKEESQKTMQERIARIQQEKDAVDVKYEQKRKALKELEKNVQQSQSQADREKAVQFEKYENLERQQKELIKNYEIENLKLQEQNDQLNQALSQGELGIREQVEHWKSQYYEMERQHADLQSELEKEKALWEGKFEFLEKQKEQAKKDNEDALRQFQQTVDQLQRSQSESKQKHDNNHNSVLMSLEQKFKKELKEGQEANTTTINQLQANIRRLEKEKNSLNERLEISSKSMMSEQGGLEKKMERIHEERDRLKEELELHKADKDKKIEEMKRQFEREKDVLKQKNNDLQQKSKNTDSKQTELILSHETNRAKWDQEKSYLLSAKEDAISELKSMQRKFENQVAEIQRLKEQSKQNKWRANKERMAGNLNTNNPMLLKMGEGVLGRLNLGGAGAGLNRPAGGNDLSSSQNNFDLSKGTGGIGTYRSNIGVDKSMDNFKLGFQNKFGGQLGATSGLGLGGSASSGAFGGAPPTQGAASAVIQPQNSANNLKLGLGGLGQSGVETNLDNSMRKSNVISTPNSSKGKFDEDTQEFDNN